MCEAEVNWNQYYKPVYDDVNGGELDPALVEKGEMEEMETNERTMVMEEMVVKMVTQRRMEMEKQKVNQVMEIQAAMS